MWPASDRASSAPRPMRVIDAGAGIDVGRVFEESFGFVWANLRRLGVAEADLDDAVQEVFVVVHRRAHALHDESALRSWLYGILRRIAHRHRRGATRRRRLVDAVANEPLAGFDPEDEVVAREAVRLVDGFLARLDERKREVFVLAELEQVSGREIAAMLRIPHDTVWSRLRSAREAFDRHFARLRAEHGRSGGLDPRHAITIARQAHGPPASARKRVAAALALRLADPVVAAPIGSIAAVSWAEVKLFAIIVAVGSAGLLGAREVLVPDVQTPERPTIAAHVDVPSAPRSEHVPQGSAQPVVAAAAAVEPAAPREPTPPTATRTRPHERPRADESPKAASLREETRLLAEARAAHEAGEAARALALADDHARRFPDGELVQERVVMRIAALCSLGRDDEALREGASLAVRGGSARLAQGCPEKMPTKSAASGDGTP